MSALHPKKAYCELTLFNYETTYRSDYREGDIHKLIKTQYIEKPPRQRKPYENIKYIGTMLNWKKRMPFDALWTAKDIVRTNPNLIQQPFEKIKDNDREKAQLTRPRLIMTPAVSIDDMDKERRDILVKETYTSEMSARTREAVTPFNNIKAPMPDGPGAAAWSNEKIQLSKLRRPYVPEEWRIESAFWDRRQLRSSIGATEYFWLRPEHAPSRCQVCEETAILTAIVQADRKKSQI